MTDDVILCDLCDAPARFHVNNADGYALACGRHLASLTDKLLDQDSDMRLSVDRVDDTWEEYD